MSLLDKLKQRVLNSSSFLRKTEVDPWEGYDPDAVPEEMTPEQMAEAVEKMKRRLRVRPPYLSYLGLATAFLWVIGHAFMLYVMIGSPTQGAFALVVLVNLLFLGHYMILLVTNIGRHRNAVA